jgi:hypothetical protein
MWNDGTAFPYIRNRSGFTENYLSQEKIKIISKNNEIAELKCGRFVITIKQFVFEEMSAVRIHFDNLKKLIDADMSGAYEVSILQVEATSVDDARILPPNSYASKNAIWLETFMPSLSSLEYRQQQPIINEL